MRNAAAWYILITTAALPIAFGPAGYAHITAVKYAVFTVLAGAFLIVSMAGAGRRLPTGGSAVLRTPSSAGTDPLLFGSSLSSESWLLAAYLLFSLASALISTYTKTAFLGSDSRREGFITILLYVSSFFLIAGSLPDAFSLRRKQRIRFGGDAPGGRDAATDGETAVSSLLTGFLIVTGIVAVLWCSVCLLQFFGHNPLHLYPDGYDYYGGNYYYAGIFMGTTGNADIGGALLSLLIPLFAGSLAAGRQRLRFLLVIPLALCIGVLLYSQVMAGIVGAAAAIVIGAAVKVDAHRMRSRTGQKACCPPAAGKLSVSVLRREGIARILLCTVLIAMLILCTAAAFWPMEPADSGSNAVSAASAGPVLSWLNDAGSGRIYIWAEALRLAAERPLLGSGPDSFGLVSEAVFTRYDAALGATIRSAVDVAHNEYLNILVNQGIPAALAYAGALLCTLWRWAEVGRRNPNVYICGLAVLGYAVQAFFSFSMCASAALFWICWGLTEGFLRRNCVKRVLNA